MTRTTDRAPAPPGWAEALAESEAQVAAGLTVPLEPVLDRLRASAERMETRQAQGTKAIRQA